MSVPSLDAAADVVDFILDQEMKTLADQVGDGDPTIESLRELLAVTIAVVGATEYHYNMLGRPHPTRWESMERSAATFMDHYVVKTLAADAPDIKRAVTKQRRRKLTVRAGRLRLVESDRNKRSRWAAVTLPPDAPIPIAQEVADGLHERMLEAEERLYNHLASALPNDPLVLAGRVVGLLTACELLLALLPSKPVAAFCVQVGAMSAAQRPDEPGV